MSEKFKKSLHIYICHYTKYTERKKYIQSQLDKLKLDPNNIHFIEKYHIPINIFSIRAFI